MNLTLVQQVVNGVALGMLLALMAVGLTVVLGLMRVINMAHGALYTLGAYAVITTFDRWGFFPSLVAATVAVGVVGFALERVLIRPLYARDPLHTLLVTFGLALMVEDVVRIVWGDAPHAMAPPEVFSGILLLGDVPFSKYRLFVIAVSAALMLLTWLFLERTQLGRTILAGTFDREMVRVLGIRINLLFTLVFGLGAALAGLAGALASPIRGVFPGMGSSIIMPSFVVVIIGGMGSFGGALIGGLSVGIIISLAVEFFPAGSDVVVFMLLAVVLLVRPRGLFGVEGLLSR